MRTQTQIINSFKMNRAECIIYMIGLSILMLPMLAVPFVEKLTAGEVIIVVLFVALYIFLMYQYLRSIKQSRKAMQEMLDTILHDDMLATDSMTVYHLEPAYKPMYDPKSLIREIDDVECQAKKCTCHSCGSWLSCEYAFDAYNTNGDCLAIK